MFASNGEKLDDFDVFHPDRMASRILDMGDVLTLIEQAEKAFDRDQATEMAQKLSTGTDFTLEDFLSQMQQVRKMGSLSKLLGMLPGMGEIRDQIDSIDDRDLDRVQAIIQSMTPLERHDPKISTARRRIANGSGTTVTEVNQLVERFFAARTMMKQLSGMGLAGMPGMPGLPGGRRKASGGGKGSSRRSRRPRNGRAGARGPGRSPLPSRPAPVSVRMQPRQRRQCRPCRQVFSCPRSSATCCPRIALTEVASRSAARPHPALHVRGIVLPDGQARDLWLADGQVRTTSVRDATSVGAGFLLPGLVDAHSPRPGAPRPVPDRGDQEDQAIRVDTGALLVRDCGSPVDTRWMDSAPTFPVSSAPVGIWRVPGAICPAWVSSSSRTSCPMRSRCRPRPVTGGSSWWATGSTVIPATWRRAGLPMSCSQPSSGRTPPRVTVHTFSEDALPDLLAADVDCIEHGTGLSDDLIAVMAERGTALVPTLINIDTFPMIADRAARFPAYAAHMRRLHATARDRVRTAAEAGVPVFAGSDAGAASPWPHCRRGGRAARAGLSGEDAVAATSCASLARVAARRTARPPTSALSGRSTP